MQSFGLAKKPSGCGQVNPAWTVVVLAVVVVVVVVGALVGAAVLGD